MKRRCTNVCNVYHHTLWGQEVSVAADRPMQGNASAQHVVHTCQRSVKLTGDRPSLVYRTDSPTKMTAPEMISCPRVTTAHQNLNGSSDLTTPLSGMVYHSWTSICYPQPTYQI